MRRKIKWGGGAKSIFFCSEDEGGENRTSDRATVDEMSLPLSRPHPRWRQTEYQHSHAKTSVWSSITWLPVGSFIYCWLKEKRFCMYVCEKDSRTLSNLSQDRWREIVCIQHTVLKLCKPFFISQCYNWEVCDSKWFCSINLSVPGKAFKPKLSLI